MSLIIIYLVSNIFIYKGILWHIFSRDGTLYNEFSTHCTTIDGLYKINAILLGTKVTNPLCIIWRAPWG